MKNWDITIAQLVLLVVGGYYMYGAFTNIQYHNGQLAGQPKSFVLTMTIGIILLGLALALQQIRSYRRRKASSLELPAHIFST